MMTRSEMLARFGLIDGPGLVVDYARENGDEELASRIMKAVEVARSSKRSEN
jgi:hypothetical protein